MRNTAQVVVMAVAGFPRVLVLAGVRIGITCFYGNNPYIAG